MTTVTAPAKGPRLLSIDVLRGVTIAFMILVNNNGDERVAYHALVHSHWNGFTPTDLVFPTFLFVMGISLVFSTMARLQKGESRATLVSHIIRRTLLLFLFGLIVNGFPFFHLGTLRIYGVLQRFAVCYLIASLTLLVTRRAAVFLALTAVSLIGYWALMRFVPVPGHGMPVRDFPILDPNINLVAWIDRHIFPGRLYEGTRDPEGLLSNLPALGTTFLGILTALWLRTTRSQTAKCLGMVGAGVAMLVVAMVWDPSFPINKKLWTSSFVLFAGGWSMLALALSYFLVEIRNWRGSWTMPALVFGSNAITAYVFSELLSGGLGAFRLSNGASVGGWIYRTIFSPIPNPAFRSLTYSLAFVLVCWLFVLALYRKRIFLKL